MKIFGILSSVLILMVFVTTVYGQDASLVLALSFDEGQGTVANDSSKYRFKADINGALWVNGKFGKALSFDGVDDFASVADAPELRLLKGGTIMTWAYIMAGGHTAWPRLIHKSNTTGGTGPGYEILFDRALGDSVRPCLGGACNTFNPVSRDAWRHIAMTLDGTTIKIFVDGAAAGEIAQPGPVIDSPDMPLIIGNSFNAQRQFQGYVDEVRRWSRVLDINEVKAQMNMATQDVVSSVTPHTSLTTTWAKLKS